MAPNRNRVAWAKAAMLGVAAALVGACAEPSLQDHVRNGDFDEVAAAIRANPAAVHSVDRCGWTPLHVAVYYQFPEIVDDLLDRKVDINARTTRNSASCRPSLSAMPAGSTPLIIAAYYGNVRIVRTLLKHGADVRPKSEEGYTAVAYAREFQFRKVTRLLTEAASQQAGASDDEDPASPQP